MELETTRRHPIVTVIMPIRNEAAYIRRSLSAVLAQDYPADRLEILVVDGMSADETRAFVQRTIEEQECFMNDGHPSISIINNPTGIVPSALNIGLRHAKGDIVIRVDGHCEVAPNYVRRCVEVLQETGVDCVGGPWETVGETWVARAIALSQSSFLGIGGAAFRTGRGRRGYVDTVPFGTYRREIFGRIGMFDEELVRNQDDEFNFRLIQAGGRIWLDPAIRCVYYSRATLRQLWQQYFQYGFYKVRVMQKRRGIASWRHVVPGAFVVGLVVSMLLSLITRQPLWTISAVALYAAVNLLSSLWISRRDVRVLPILPVAYATLHLSYGCGFLLGLWQWSGNRSGFCQQNVS